jgi:hypothetical protein
VIASRTASRPGLVVLVTIVGIATACEPGPAPAESDAGSERPTLTPPPETDTDPGSETPSYASREIECVHKVGRILPFSCMDGELIPVTRHGVPVGPAELEADPTCDHPSWFGSGVGSRLDCVSGSRLVRIDGLTPDGLVDPDQVWVALCRRIELRPDDDPHFEDIALIGHRLSTGATCFYNSLPGYSTNGENIGQPNGSVWLQLDLMPGDGAEGLSCTSCHASDPFLHSPWIDQVRDADGDPLVPLVADPGAPYYALHAPEEDQPMYLDLPDNACTSCHRIGLPVRPFLVGVERFVRYATGLESPGGLVSEQASWPHSVTMPPGVTETMDHETYDATYSEDVQAVLACLDEGPPTRQWVCDDTDCVQEITENEDCPWVRAPGAERWEASR